MKLLQTSLFLAAATGALLLPMSAPAARNIQAKPSAAVCAEARSRGQILPGCPKPDNDVLDRPSGTGSQPPPGSPPEAEPDSADGQQDDQGPREGFMICPGDSRCPVKPN